MVECRAHTQTDLQNYVFRAWRCNPEMDSLILPSYAHITDGPFVLTRWVARTARLEVKYAPGLLSSPAVRFLLSPSVTGGKFLGPYRNEALPSAE